MTLTNLLKYKEVHLLLAFIFSFLLIVDKGYFPYFSVFLFFVTYLSINYFLIGVKTKFTHSLFIVVLILSALVFIKVNPILTFLNIAVLIYIQAIFILSSKINYFSDIVFAIPRSLETLIIQTDITVSYLFNKLLKEKNIKINFLPILFGLLVTLLCISFLLGTNPIFDSYAKTLGKLFTETGVLWLIRSVFALLLAALSFRAYSAVTNYNIKTYNDFSKNTFAAIAGIFVVVLVFIASQFQFYSLSEEALKALGYSNSEYTREIFAQMVGVSVLIAGCVFFNSNRNKYIRILSIFTIFEGFVLLAFGLRSDYLYISNWGLTIKRLYGLVAIYLIFSTNILYLLKEKLKQNFAQLILLNALVTLLFVNIVNFDYLISIYSPKTQNGKDYNYISKLSLDANLRNDFLDEINKEMEKEYLYIKGAIYNNESNKLSEDWDIEPYLVSDITTTKTSGYFCVYKYLTENDIQAAYNNWVYAKFDNQRKYLKLGWDIRSLNLTEYLDIISQNLNIRSLTEIERYENGVLDKRFDKTTLTSEKCGNSLGRIGYEVVKEN
ncbi:DUF4173 domain-containing protein [Patescibacteria group bacterium]|nr:DUF4173 domain-containing protein [Patescibacteria group bacterium]